MDDLEEVAALDKQGKYSEAFHMLTELAREGNLDAAYMLGLRCKGMPHIPDAVITAYGGFCIAAREGHLDAKLEMDMLAKGMTEAEIKLGQDFARSFMPALTSAQRKIINEAVYNISDIDKSIETFADVLAILKEHSKTDRIAVKVADAEKGDKDAQFDLGQIYTNGAVIRANKSRIIAFMFFYLSEKNGHPRGQSVLMSMITGMPADHSHMGAKFAKDWIKIHP